MSAAPDTRPDPVPAPVPEEGPRIVLPTPGRPREPEPAPEGAAPPRPAAPMAVSDILEGFRLDGGQVPVLVAEAAPLLNLADVLRQRETPPDLAALRAQTVEAVRAYETRLGAAGIPPQQARAAHYVVCATLDDVTRSRPWGEGWSVEGLVSTFHHDVTGGDEVFELLAHFQAAPGANRDLLLLIYLCLSLGFAGRTRVSRRGGLELMQTRENLCRILRAQFGAPEHDLSPHWRGQDAAHEPLGAPEAAPVPGAPDPAALGPVPDALQPAGPLDRRGARGHGVAAARHGAEPGRRAPARGDPPRGARSATP